MKLESLSNFADLLIKRIEDKFDNVIITESGSVKGTGKTTFSTLLTMEVDRKKDFKFSIQNQIVFDPTNEKIIEQVKTKPPCYPLQVDEASKVAYRRNWADEKQKRLMIFANVCRKYYKIINLNNPGFWKLDRDLLEIADFRITILKRGIAIVRGKIKNPEADDLWMRKITDELIRSAAPNQMDIDKVINALRKAPNYLFEIHFGELDPEVYAEYEKISQETELQSFFESQQNKWRFITEALVGFLSYAKKHTGEYPFSWTDICREVNYHLRIRTGIPGGLLSTRLRDMAAEGEGFGLQERLNKAVIAQLSQKKPQTADSRLNNKNNTLMNEREGDEGEDGPQPTQPE